MPPAQDVSNSPDDEKILKYAGELFRQLGITKPEPDAVIWDNDIRSHLVVVRYGEVRLPQSFKGQLTPEDWKTLLAPEIIYNYVLLRDDGRDPALHLLLPLAPAPFPLAFALIALFRSGRGPYYLELLLTIMALYVLYSGIVLGLYIRRRWRRLFYDADRRTADKFGKQELLATLAKYGEAISATGYPRKRFHLWPTVNQRIERLQKATEIAK
ncbi:MAG TPA: hypothetical protein VGS11_07300 [Candidatus Bathyarchaeia archaeon]|nr:hypothetical protein [Candidatus Bathyarchaeia archaeon]